MRTVYSARGALFLLLFSNMMTHYQNVNEVKVSNLCTTTGKVMLVSLFGALEVSGGEVVSDGAASHHLQVGPESAAGSVDGDLVAGQHLHEVVDVGDGVLERLDLGQLGVPGDAGDVLAQHGERGVDALRAAPLLLVGRAAPLDDARRPRDGRRHEWRRRQRKEIAWKRRLVLVAGGHGATGAVGRAVGPRAAPAAPVVVVLRRRRVVPVEEAAVGAAAVSVVHAQAHDCC